MREHAELLDRTRVLTVIVTVLLAAQLSGNLYEQVVTNAQTIAAPRPGALVGALDVGSPLYFYVPWVQLGLVLAVVLARRVQRTGPAQVARRLRLALAALAVAVATKIILITSVNPAFRDPTLTPEQVREAAITWSVGNGVAILAVAAALVLILSWRGRSLSQLAREQRASPGGGGGQR